MSPDIPTGDPEVLSDLFYPTQGGLSHTPCSFLSMGKCLDDTTFLHPAKLGLKFVFLLWDCRYAQVCVRVPISAARMSICVCLQATCKGTHSFMVAHGKNRPQNWVKEAKACGALKVPVGDGYMCVFVQGMVCRQNILISA